MRRFGSLGLAGIVGVLIGAAAIATLQACLGSAPIPPAVIPNEASSVESDSGASASSEVGATESGPSPSDAQPDGTAPNSQLDGPGGDSPSTTGEAQETSVGIDGNDAQSNIETGADHIAPPTEDASEAGPAPTCADVGNECVPAGTTCRTGRIECVNGSSVCTDAGPAVDGDPCGINMSCSAGVCACAVTTCPSGCVDTSSDVHNCGSCGHDCGPGTCSASTCQPGTIATANDANALALDSTNLYWGSSQNVVKMALATGVQTTLANTQTTPAAITVDASNVYWTISGSGAAMGSVMECAIGGCSETPTPLATMLSSPWGIAALGTDVYVGVYSSSPIQAIPIVPGTATALATTSTGEPAGVAVDASNAYWVAPGGGTVNKCSLGGCGANSTTLASGLMFPSFIALDAGNVYWTDETSGGAVMKCAKTGCSNSPETLASGGTPAGIFVYNGTVYWADSSPTGGVFSCAAGGCNMVPTTVVNSGAATNVVVDSTHVYWIASGSIQALTR